DRDDVYLLRPLAGATDEIAVVQKRLADLVGYELPEERVRPSVFPSPTVNDLSDAASAHLLWQAARLTLREGATPFRSLGRISIRPRVYQFVPLLMALRLDRVRLFIADDVGVGKTIEALLVARELLDRGDVRRFCVLCPPYLCDQWQSELAEKFNLEAVVIRSGTVSQLDRRKPAGKSIYEYFPIQVISIDWVKSDRNKQQFLLHSPELVIVDEVHGAAAAGERNQNQQQRHQLLLDVASDPERHLILLTATPHSGIEAAFRSLLGLLRPEFGGWNVNELDEGQRITLARHFVQRTRKDIESDWEGEHCFPVRETPPDETYGLSEHYRQLFRRAYDFCSEIVRTGEGLGGWRQRVRYWGALALLRCVMSSPAAAIAALDSRQDKLPQEAEEEDFRAFVFESTQDRTNDESPTPPLEAAESTLEDAERRRLRELARLAENLLGPAQDSKLARCVEIVKKYVDEGFHPIVWCRYIATADYVAEALRGAMPPEAQVAAVTGRIGDDERRAKIEQISPDRPRVLVATDCLSEGINLQNTFSAVLHYDLPWNPNRLEQREGRVDRYGGPLKVRAVRFFGRDNPVDGVVIDVLLNKAREIRRALGTYLPVPDESESVTEALMNALFLRKGAEEGRQLSLDLGLPQVAELHRRMELDAEREYRNRTRFAQRAIKPEEVIRELQATDAVLGDPDAVRQFVLAAGQRLGLRIERSARQKDVFRVAVSEQATATVSEAVCFALPAKPAGKDGQWLISFVSPTPEGAEYLGRNHRFVAAVARFLMEDALTKQSEATVSRCGVIRTTTVKELTTVLLLRVRYLIEQPQKAPLMSEEIVVLGYTSSDSRQPQFLEDAAALWLLAEAKPEANVPIAEKKELVSSALNKWQEIEGEIRLRLERRANELEESHKRIRRAVSLRVRELAVKPQLPPDMLGLLVMQPFVSV
ncbi:MAG: helicase-related protein, partial [Rhizomicrobium sp.]